MGRKMKRAFRRLIPPNTSFNPYVTMKVFHFLPKAKKKQKQKTDKKNRVTTLKGLS